MKANRLAEQNLDLAFDVIKQTLSEPDAAAELETLAGNSVVVLFDPDDELLAMRNDHLADRLERAGEPVVRVEVHRHLSLQPR